MNARDLTVDNFFKGIIITGFEFGDRNFKANNALV